MYISIGMKRIPVHCVFKTKKENRKMGTSIPFLHVFLVKPQRDWLWDLCKISTLGLKKGLRKQSR